MLVYFLAGVLLGFAIAVLLLELKYRWAVRSLQRSFAVKRGKIVEQLAPYLQNFPYDPQDARFIGNPVDFIVFDGLSEGKDVNIVFVEVKSGKAGLNENERKIREAVEKKRIRYEIFRQ